MPAGAGRRASVDALIGLFALLSFATASGPAAAEPIGVRFAEGVTRAFPVLRNGAGEKLAQGDFVQIARGDRIENRMTFRVKDGSLYDERVVFSQHDSFRVERYTLVQRGPSFPEALETSFDRASGRYAVRYKADENSPEEMLAGQLELPDDVYNGMLMTVMKNLPTGASATVEIIAFTPRPRLVKMLLTPAAQDPVMVGDTAMVTTRFLVRPQLGLFASLLIVDIPDVKCWIVSGEAPAFLRFEGPLYFMGPVWRIEPN